MGATLNARHVHDIKIVGLCNRLNLDDQIVEVLAAVGTIVFQVELEDIVIQALQFKQWELIDGFVVAGLAELDLVTGLQS